MKMFCKMLKIETKLSIRDMNMVIFAIIMPLVIQVIIGVIYKNKPAFEGAEYTFLEQSFGAICSISICAGGLMGIPILISEYRERKILKRFKVTPVSPTVILFVQLCIYTLYSLISMILNYVVVKLFWNISIRGSIILFILGWLFVVISIFSIGIVVGALAKNSKSASVVASILYFPMLVFSGATLPYEVMPKMMQNIVDVFPLTQGIKILKAITLGTQISSINISIIILLLISSVCTFISIKYFKWE